jgi:hypothetical protein
MSQELKEKFIGIFETKLLPFSQTKEAKFHQFVDLSMHFLPENLQETTQDLIEWLGEEFESLKTWRPANNSYDKARIEESEDAIVLYDDIQNYLIFVNQETFKIELINNLLQLLGKLYQSHFTLRSPSSLLRLVLVSELLGCQLHVLKKAPA